MEKENLLKVRKWKTIGEAIERVFSPDSNIKTTTYSSYELLDKKVLGLKPSQFHVLGARPGVGKTTFLVNLINNIIKKDFSDDDLVIFLTLEMRVEEIAEKLLSIASGVNLSIFNPENIEQAPMILKDFRKELSSKNIWLIDNTRITVNQIREIVDEAERLKLRVRSVMVDHIQLIEEKSSSSRYEKITKISRDLKELALDKKTNIFGLSQLSRSSEKKTTKTTELTLGDLRDSGAIEQDADVVYLLSEVEGTYNEHQKRKNLSLTIAKNRNGILTSGEFFFDLKNGRITQIKKEVNLND